MNPAIRRTLRIVAILAATGMLLWAFASHTVHWTKNPGVTIVAADDDPRIALAMEATTHWNRILAELGSPFRLGEVRVIHARVSGDDIKTLGNQIRYTFGSWWPWAPKSLRNIPGDLVVVLSDEDFISCTAHRGSRVIVAIKNGSALPLRLPNVTRNVIAHELGHAIGLRHNRDPKLLMCGRPAACRPDAFASSTPGFFPLSKEEQERLLALYPGQ